MNYIKELNAFHTKNIFDPLSSSAVALWSALMYFNNLCGWKKEFSVAASQLQTQAGLKATSFKDARKELQQAGRILVTSRGSNRAAMYQMVSQQMTFELNNDNDFPSNSPVVTQPEQHSDQPQETPLGESSSQRSLNDCTTNNDTSHNNDYNADHTTDPFFKQKDIKQNTNQTTTGADAVRFYQDNFGMPTPFISEDIIGWINDVSEPLVLHAMTLALEQDKKTWRYVKGILRAWAKKGITTLEAAKAEELAYQKKTYPSYEQRQTEVIPDWFKERKQQQRAANQAKKMAASSTVEDRKSVV